MSPLTQAYYHAGCACRHVGKAVAALWTTAIFRGLVFLAATAVLSMLCGCATTSGARWYAPATWFSHAPVAAVDSAKHAVVAADRIVDVAESAVVHSANVESAKTGIAIAAIPPGRARDLAARFSANTSGLLSQVTPLTAVEAADLRQIVADLLSENQQIVLTAEANQRASEIEQSRLSRALSAANAERAALRAALEAKQQTLRNAFDRENALANDLRAQHARFWIALGVAVLLLGFAIYARIALGGVGAALHAAGAPAAVISAIDGNLSAFGQWLIRTGREAAAKAEAVTKLP
jgi:hypothetical protein